MIQLWYSGPVFKWHVLHWHGALEEWAMGLEAWEVGQILGGN